MKNYLKILGWICAIYFTIVFIGYVYEYDHREITSAPTPTIEVSFLEPDEDEIVVEEEEFEVSLDDEIKAITDITEKITEIYGSSYKGCTFSSSKYVIFRLSIGTSFFYANHSLIEQNLNEISKFGHSHLPSGKNCTIMIEDGEKCLFISENGRGTKY